MLPYFDIRDSFDPPPPDAHTRTQRTYVNATVNAMIWSRFWWQTPGGTAVVQGRQTKKNIKAHSTAQQIQAPQKTPNQTAPLSTNERNAEDGDTTTASARVEGEAGESSTTRDEDLALVCVFREHKKYPKTLSNSHNFVVNMAVCGRE